MKKKQKLKAEGPPLTVAVAHTPRGIAAACDLRRDKADLVEIRLDGLVKHRELIRQCLPAIKLPVLLTARHPREGGVGTLTTLVRRNLLEEFLPWASAVDIEMRSTRSMRSLLTKAEKQGVLKVFSFHDFRATPSLIRLKRLAAQARQEGADIVKIATSLRHAADLVPLLHFQTLAGKHPAATMGMGPLGCVSRLTLAAAGSRLNYGYLDRPQVTGQWPAARLHSFFAEVIP